MLIGIDGSRAFIKNRTGIEEYSYQVIKHLINELSDVEVFLYVRKNQDIDFNLPEKWKVVVVKFPRFWTQIGLSLEMLLHPVDVLFVPAHTVPMIHPKKTIVVVHGLEYEFCPKAYSFFERIYMRISIRNSCRWASGVISVSENTKKDLIGLYHISSEKIKVIYEGYVKNNQSPVSSNQNNSKIQSTSCQSLVASYEPYLLFIGRIEERKNVINIIKAFDVLKERYNLPHKLILAGKPGFGYEKIRSAKSKSKNKKDILELGFVSEDQKWELLKNADVFIFPTQYEGFGIPILEAQSAGCPVVASDNSSIPEVMGKGGLLVNSQDLNSIAENIYKVILNEKTKNTLVNGGFENVKRFSWEKCAKEIAEILNEK